ncbi:MAMMALIAN LYST-INTERACTING PROTEIN 5-like protein [Senna tora]|uniref:MAMMALIAN LYST-INTERACTING PROTEIN 5-like protein n=1 Tax=Senna tora TaxID=362788 RepID=A0A834T685_9FABA|nr:MAMMALIAN LYST-INTERACTING PROTEIN 5-like protein [Senna tora]
MGSENEPAKLLLPYLQRADELQKHEPLVAYYCRLYAMERGLKIPQNERTKTTNSLLVSLMKQLEKDKKSIKLTPEDNLHVEGFALNVFGKADKQDRAGRADLNTAKTFYAASIFFEILNQFGALQPDLEEKQKYAAWKAADIRKALKEGRKPTAGPPAGDEDLSVPSDTANLETTETSVTSAGPESDLSHNYNDAVNFQHSPSIPPAPKFHGTVDNQHSTNIAPSMQFQDGVNNSQQSSNISRSSSAYSSASYPSQDYYPPPPASSESPYSQTYHQQYSQEHSPHLATNNYLSHETPSSFSYPHFQSYPSFSESSLPSVPVNYTHYQGSDASYPSQSAPLTTNYTSSAEQNSRSRNEAVSEPHSASQTYQYDSNYQPSPEKIAEAHKSARFAVGALAFDDVSVAVDYLRKSLELLTNPSAGQ